MEEMKAPEKHEGFIRRNVAVLSLIAAIVGTIVSVLTAYRFASPTPPATYGACGLTVQKPVDVNRARGLVQSGIKYGSQRNFDLARRQFEEVLRIDPNYLGANLNLGVAYLNLNRNEDAQKAFNNELRIVECIASVDRKDFPQFAYVLAGNADQYSKRLDQMRDAIHFNLACALNREHEAAGAMEELKSAALHHSINKAAVEKETDLVSLKGNPNFDAVLAQFARDPQN